MAIDILAGTCYDVIEEACGSSMGSGHEEEKMRHVHKVKTSEQRCFLGPVAQKQNRAAHGDRCRYEKCSCGASRRVNINGQNVERGRWEEADEQ